MASRYYRKARRETEMNRPMTNSETTKNKVENQIYVSTLHTYFEKRSILALRPNLTANLEPSAETNPQRCVSALGAVPLGILTVDVEPSAWGTEYSGINIKRT